ncbi:glycoside hydrolase family 32 protein [Streptomyces sp.]|uniref:glycoside hydrolase family 32 protein n=1 Tax=Streptomyces sp. TaxID=1931 RepID=UPI002F414383
MVPYDMPPTVPPTRRSLIKAAVGVSLAAGASALGLPRPAAALSAAGSSTLAQSFTNPFVLPPDDGYYDETYRPQFHFSAEKNKINDPNGLVYYGGEYHLSYQYNLFQAVHWGHAVSTDLVHWTHLPPALLPDAIGQIWSGSSAVDWNNTSGLQTGSEKVLVSVFTYSEHVGHAQSQGLAYSNDRGRTWTMYAGNPVLPNPGKPDFRDPKLFWHAPTGRWIMVLTGGDHLDFYTSPNLKQWTYARSWGAGIGAHGGAWECPDLFEITVDGTTTKKWVLSVSVTSGAPAGGGGMQYFTGRFDGTTFVNDNPPGTVLWQDYGKDYYAGVTWNDIPATDGRRLMIAWADNWQYRDDSPTAPFNGQLSLIRELRLKKYPEGLRLVQNPVAQYTALRGTAQSWQNQTISPTTANLLSGVQGDRLEIVAEFAVNTATATDFGIKVRTGATQSTSVGYDRTAARMYVDRTQSGLVPNPTGNQPNANWPNRASAPLTAVNGTVKLRMFVDRSLVELFGNDREQITERILPDRGSLGLQTYAVGGQVKLTSLTAYQLGSTWPATSPVTSTGVSAWTTVRGAWADTIAGIQGSADDDGFLLSDRTGSDLSLSADITVMGVLPGNPVPIQQEAVGALMIRADATATRGYVANIDAANDSVRLFRFNGDGTATTLGQYATPIATNTAYNLRITASGSSIQVYLGGVRVIDAVDTVFRGGYCGLNVWNAATLFKNIACAVTADFATNLSGWQPTGGTWTYTAQGISGSAPGDAFLMSAETARDFVYQADFTISAAGGARAGTLVFRANADASQGYGVNVDAGADCVTFFKWGNGGGVISRYTAVIDTGTTYRLRVEATGPDFRVLLNDNVVITASDPTYGQGRLALNVYNSTTVIQNAALWRAPVGQQPLTGAWTELTDGWQGEASGDGFLMSAESAADLTYEADVRINGTVGGKGAAALVFRANSNATQGYVANMDALNDVVTLFTFNGDGSTTVLKRHFYSIDLDRTYRLGIRARGTGILVLLDGEVVIDVRDTRYSTGLLGLNVWNSRATLRDITFAPLT